MMETEAAVTEVVVDGRKENRSGGESGGLAVTTDKN